MRSIPVLKKIYLSQVLDEGLEERFQWFSSEYQFCLPVECSQSIAFSCLDLTSAANGGNLIGANPYIRESFLLNFHTKR